MQLSSSGNELVTGRSYGQHCGIARALDLVGERWGLLVVRELVVGPKRFTDLRRGLPGIATNVLTQRLKQLERDGIVCRRTLPPPAAATVYELTEYGRELEPIMLAFGRWGAKTLGLRGPEHTLRSEWLVVALKAYFRPETAKGLRATVGLELTEGAYTLRIAAGALAAQPGAPEVADLTLDSDEETLVGFLRGDVPASALTATGDAALLERLPALFGFRGD